MTQKHYLVTVVETIKHEIPVTLGDGESIEDLHEDSQAIIGCIGPATVTSVTDRFIEDHDEILGSALERRREEIREWQLANGQACMSVT